MRQTMGFLLFLLAVIFASGLLMALFYGAWYNQGHLDKSRVIIAFFGFSISLFFIGNGVSILWENNKNLMKTLASFSILFSIFFGIGVIRVLYGWILIEDSTSVGIDYFFGFAIPMIILGLFGINILLDTKNN